jgi:hypothetical protein
MFQTIEKPDELSKSTSSPSEATGRVFVLITEKANPLQGQKN